MSSQLSLARLVVDPDHFFEDQSTDPSLLGPFIVVLLAAITSITSIVYLFARMSVALPTTARAFASLTYTISIVLGFLGVFVGWVGTAALLFAMSQVFDGEGSFRSVFVVSGWAYFPSILAGITSVLVIYAVYHGATFPTDPQKIQPFIDGFRQNPYFTVSKILTAAFTVWQGLMWTFAIKHTRTLTDREALLAAALPTVIVLGFQVTNLV